MLRALSPPCFSARFISCSAPADWDPYQTALLVRVTPASEKVNPEAAPPSLPLKPRLIALIWLRICASVTAPADPSVTTCQYTGTVTDKLLGARPLAAFGRSRTIWPVSLSRTRPWPSTAAPPRASAPKPAPAAAISSGEHAQAGRPLARERRRWLARPAKARGRLTRTASAREVRRSSGNPPTPWPADGR